MTALPRRIEAYDDGVRIEALEWSPASDDVLGVPLVMVHFAGPWSPR